MDVQTIREFIVFSRYLNFSKAAGQLNMAQPTLSSHMAALEREVGFGLIDRDKRLSLTPAGKRFCADAERIMREIDSMLEACRSISERRAGTLTVERPIRVGGIAREFDQLMLQFQKAHPEIAVNKQTSNGLSLAEMLESGHIDIAFVINASEGMLGAKLASKVESLPAPDRKRGPYYLWMDKSHPLANRDLVKLEDLEGCYFLIPASIRYQSLENLARFGMEMADISVRCSYWPGSYEECIVNIQRDETMIVCDYDLRDPAYELVANRVCVPLDEKFEKLVRPSFIYLKSNGNHALDVLRAFAQGK